MYLVKQHRKFWAMHDIPRGVQEALGQSGRNDVVRGKDGRAIRFFQNLETDDKRIAEIRAAPLKGRWLAEIEAARRQSPDLIEQSARFWFNQYRGASDADRVVVLDSIKEEAERMVIDAAWRAGVMGPEDPRWAELKAQHEAERFFDLATGQMTRTDEHLEEWIATLSNEAKSKDMKRSTVLKFAEVFPYVQDVKRKEVQRWVNRLVQEEGRKAATVRRTLSEVRGYWAYLISIEVLPEDSLPFEKLTLPKEGAKEAVRDERKRFSPAEVVMLLRAAEAKGDTQLADLIRLGMWTGARLEELCSLRVDHVGDGYFEVVDAKSKAGWRRVPVHSKLAPTLDRLVASSRDAQDRYVMAGLSSNKYEDRSNAIGKRFGRLKKEAGFGPQYVFHSIRHTVATHWKSALIDVSISADILGHEHDGMTYGQYGDVAYWKTLVDVVELLDYPETTGE
ncbi:hypothetical protein A6A04_21115 [Paramagnetospirillum marisnigri]|uniref:Tyr recombinase domain-containing protein n=1 Tax=Paramagnetospirillum marisnigri TaxID=1285242 RepID=A0A178M7P7_9PROT|nr:tyrosine-type recombinase/integrase [Paramagnetospirillum marisnigri]OAN44237.1 hypothetical protein A6A04_21115 [Paramagnetospirillum marisnigri]